jgi:erythromycin esterase-like protein
VPKAKPDSWEFILHETGAKDRIVFMNDDMRELWGTKEIGHRAIGVVYNPQWEYGNYVPSIIPSRYDAFIYIDKTKALHSLHIQLDGHQIPETYPFGV